MKSEQFERFIYCLYEYDSARRQFDKAAEEYEGQSPGWALQRESEAIEQAEINLETAMNNYIDARTAAHKETL